MDGITLATIGLVAATLLLVAVTCWLVFETKGASKCQIGIQTWLEMMKRFDSHEMKRARKSLAHKVRTYSADKHDQISETVMDFFEDVGTLIRYGHIDKELVESSLGYYATRWWEAMQPYVCNERRIHNDDKTIFEDLERLAKAMRLPHEQIDAAELKQFLDDEERLAVD
jgi:hypothetical protein